MSNTESLLSLDLASLRTFRLVYRLGSFSQTAAQIDVKQSTVSYTIDRLRRVAGDPLFVRQGGRIAPTERAQELLPVVERILVDAEGLLGEGDFDPGTVKGEITIGCALYGSHVILPRILPRLRRESPGLRVNIRSGFHEFVEPLLDGQIDLALLTTHYEGKGIYSETLVDEDVEVCVMDPDHPLAGRRLTEEDLAKTPHLVPRPFRTFKQPYLIEAERRGIKVDVRVFVSSASEVARYLMGTDLIAVLPTMIAHQYADRLAISELPFKPIGWVNMYWSAAVHRSKMNSWLRQMMRDEVKALPLQASFGA